MDTDTALSALRFILGHSGENGSDSADIGFFGREPLLRPDLIRLLLSESAGKARVTRSINTNGTLLDRAMLEELEAFGVRIALSLDGVPGTSDALRISPDGSSSYERVSRNFPGLLDYKPPVHIRMTVTARDAGEFCENARHLLETGFKRLSFAFDLTDPSWDDGSFSKLRDSMFRFAEWYVEAVSSGRDITVPAFDSLAKGRAVPSRGLFCGAAGSLFCIDCDGGIYPCWRFAGDPAWRMGDVRSGFSEDPARHPFNSIRQKEIPGCAGCPYAGFCGRCAWAGIQSGGRPDFISRVQCETSKAAIEAGLEACRMLIEARDPHFLTRLDAMKSVNSEDKVRLTSSEGDVFSIPKEELEKYRVK
jgi:uncharacterized protein